MVNSSRETEVQSPDYEPCGDCGFDHAYEYEEAHGWHVLHPCSYCKYANGNHETDCVTLDKRKP